MSLVINIVIDAISIAIYDITSASENGRAVWVVKHLKEDWLPDKVVLLLIML